MVTRARSLNFFVIFVALTLWAWGLSGVIFWIRWNSVTRPNAPIKELFPYGEIRIGVDASYPPFAVATSDDLYGIDIDIGKAVGKRLNVPVRFINMGYDGLYDSLKADQADILISALTIDYSRSGDVLYTVAYFNGGQVLVTDNQHPLANMNEISGHTLAFEFGSDANLTARAWLRRIAPFQLMPYETPNIALDSVRLGDSDAALVDSTSAGLYLRQHPDWRVQEVQVTDLLYAIAVSTKRGNTWAAVNNALKSLIDDRTIAAILKHWL
ncbi:MAG: transporter substrate-binding domain-containing protein [Anaerolineaceae bacterium]|nr:transporter substrate-binding domain-containing protein [Anaerolineaceae bacterium]